MENTELGPPNPGPYYAGISGLPMSEEAFDLGNGVSLRKVYAHLFAHFMMAFEKPAPGKHHPTPWKGTLGRVSFDLTAELTVPSETAARFESANAIAWAVVFALRMRVTPNTALSAVSNVPFTANCQTASDAWIQPVEVEARTFPLFTSGTLGPNDAQWIAAHWPTVLKLIKESAEFALAVDALTVGPFVHRSALTLVALWAALEALFSPSTSELRFRVSSLIAAYLEPPGAARRQRATEVGKLYDKRSAAAHGKPRHETTDVVETFILLCVVVIKILDEGRVPSKVELEQRLFGETHAGDEPAAT
jgi:hypothetical protein